MHIKFTYVDSITGASVAEVAAPNGPSMPSIPSLVLGFALESQYPTDAPVFYGTCDDDADTSAPGVLGVVTQDEYGDAQAQEMADRLALRKDELTAQTATVRWQFEQGGLTLPNGLRLLTAKDDQDRIDTVLNNFERYSLPSVEFKAASGWVTVTYEEMKALGKAVVDHVQDCFAAERAVSEQIAAAPDLDALQTIDVQTAFADAYTAAATARA